jgi:hypothetical protein
MSIEDSQFAWWSRLRHSGLLLSPIVQIEKYAETPELPKWYQPEQLRNAYTRFIASIDRSNDRQELANGDILTWVDSLLEKYVGHTDQRFARSHNIPESLTAVIRIGSRTETLRPDRVLLAEDGKSPLLLIKADTSAHIGRGKGRSEYSKFLELLRGTGHRLGLLTNGLQFRLIYAGLDFESWCEWESERWFEDSEGIEELLGFRQTLFPVEIKNKKGDVTGAGLPGLLLAIEESRKRQADLSDVLRENVRQAIELLLEDVSTANRVAPELFHNLISPSTGQPSLSTEQAHEALMQASVRLVMRLVVCLFAESRQLLPTNDPIYSQSYGVRSLYELLDTSARDEGSTQGLLSRQTAWPRLIALFRLIHAGSAHGSFPMRPYRGTLFRPGNEGSRDAVDRALHVLEHTVQVNDATVLLVLKKLLRGPLPVIKGKTKTFVEGPVDYTDLRTEFIGLIYEGLLDYRLKRTDEQFGPQIFLNIGREPVLPLSRLTDMLQKDKKGLKDLLTTLRKEKVTASASGDAEEESEEESSEEQPASETEESSENSDDIEVESETPFADRKTNDTSYLDAVEAAHQWASEAVVLTGLVSKQTKRETDTEYQARIGAEANRLIKRVVSLGEFYLVRAGNTRKGTGTFYTRPQVAVPTTHRTLEPLCYEKSADGRLIPRTPEEILSLKICDPACGSASFLVAALHYLTDALYKSLCYHRKLDDPAAAKKITLPFGRPRLNTDADQLVPFLPNDPQRGEAFEERVKALLRRHVVERCIYGVDINPLAVELARVSLWVETLDPDLPFTFLDHKIKVGNSIVGCWLSRIEDYPLKAWERDGGDGKDGERNDRILSMIKGPLEWTTVQSGKNKGSKKQTRSGDGIIKSQMREVLQAHRDAKQGFRSLFLDMPISMEQIVADIRAEYERLHELPVTDPDERERYYRDQIENSPTLRTLRRAMNEWTAVWFWPTNEESMPLVPKPLRFHAIDEDRQPDPKAQPESDKAANATAELTLSSSAIVERIAAEMKFFHWELEFPDVFTPERSGFDATIGNPPWDVMKPNSQEFFSDFDPLYRTYDKQTALKHQAQFFAADKPIEERWMEYNALFRAFANWTSNVAEPFDVSLASGNAGNILKSTWESQRRQRIGYAAPDYPFHLQGSADLNLYKMFTEVFWHLLKPGGRLGAILPTGLYSDYGTRSLREELLFRGQLDFIYAFQNERRVFTAAHHAFKQAAVFAAKGGITEKFQARFRLGVGDSPHSHEIPDDILGSNSGLAFTPESVRGNSPKTLSLLELRTPRDLTIFEKIYANSVRIGDKAPGWEITYATEFHMTIDSKHFPPLETWEKKGYVRDALGRWIGRDGGIALPLNEGRTIGQFDSSQKGWVSGKGRKAVWREIPFDAKDLEPQFLMDEETFVATVGIDDDLKLGFMDVTSATNSRTFVCTVIVRLPCGNKVPTLTVSHSTVLTYFFMAACGNSFTFDYTVRMRLTGMTLNWFIVEELPLAKGNSASPEYRRISMASASLILTHRRFAPEWLKLAYQLPDAFCIDPLNPTTFLTSQKAAAKQSATKQWKHWWAVTEADRLRLRVEIDALCAELYGLDPDDFDWIVQDDPKDPKGFYRVDRQLPFRERLTGLAAAAFRALKEGKWSAESAASLSNDEFFALLGIPELTNADAAKAAGHSGPLILKRPGCHTWHPENFPKEDPRHGWTWADCWQDAITLLGSEQAVRDYILQQPEPPATSPPEDDDAFKLISAPATRKDPQGRLF